MSAVDAALAKGYIDGVLTAWIVGTPTGSGRRFPCAQ